jgi:hypothetical protein
MPPKLFEVRACVNTGLDTIRVFQAYNANIADTAVAANSFQAALDAGFWSATRTTWIKPSACWMAYRCGWGTMKDSNQARVLALDVSRLRFFDVLRQAHLAHSKPCSSSGNDQTVVVQWDPERQMCATASRDQVYTCKVPNTRSIQIGLKKGSGSALLLDPSFVIRITDVTERFVAAGKNLSDNGDADAARACLWPDPESQEVTLDVPADIRAALGMDDEKIGMAHQALT